MNKDLRERYFERGIWCHQSFCHAVNYNRAKIRTNRVPIETVLRWGGVARNPWRRKIWEAAVRMGLAHEHKERNLPEPTDKEVTAELERQQREGLTLMESKRFVPWQGEAHEHILADRAQKAASARWGKKKKKAAKKPY